MIYLRRRIADHVDVLQEETPAVIHPLTDQARLNNTLKQALENEPFATHRNVPLPNVVNDVKCDVKIPSDGEDLDPKEQALCEELVDRLVHFLDTVATAGGS